MSRFDPFSQAIVRILDANGKIVRGMGLLVSPQRVLTCAHVANDAARVQIAFPFVAQPPAHATLSIRCVLNRQLDVAVLHLDSPVAVRGYDRLSNAISLDGKRFDAMGAPHGHEDHLIPFSGKVLRPIANGRYAVSVRHSNYKIRPGCSGAPVFERGTDLMLGLIVQEELDQSAEAGFLIPASQLAEVLRTAEQRNSQESIGLAALRTWAQKQYCNRLRLRSEVLRFIDNYQSRSNEPRPFVGREQVLLDLDRWFKQRERRFLLVSGAAGRGKSALLLHWLAQQVEFDDATRLFYVPISIRFNTSDEAAGIQLLFAALADVIGELGSRIPQQPEIEDYLDAIAFAWNRIGNDTSSRYLLVVDGVDESTNQWFLERRILPAELPPNLHVLVAARHMPGDDNGASWLTEFANQLADDSLRADAVRPLLELEPLDKAAMADALIQLGRPLDQLAERDSFISELYRLTDCGDPLLLSLWLGQIWRERSRAPDLDAQALAALLPSFGGFYERWMKEQQSVWKGHGLAIHAEDFGQVMDILAVAQGPLLLTDLVSVLGFVRSHVQWQYATLRDALAHSHRLVVGDAAEHGYVLVHPRLAFYFQQKLDESPTRLRMIRDAFLQWGAGTVQRLNSGELLPPDCPRYLLNHYVRTHLEAGRVIGPEMLAQFYVPLLQRGWAAGWYAHDGAWLGYLKDVSRLFDVLSRFNTERLAMHRPAEMRLALQIRCALLAATMRSLASSLPTQLIESLVSERMWSISRGSSAASMLNPVEQAGCLNRLAAIAENRGARGQARGLLQQALENLASVSDESQIPMGLRALVSVIKDDTELLEQARRIASRLRSHAMRDVILDWLKSEPSWNARVSQRPRNDGTALTRPVGTTPSFTTRKRLLSRLGGAGRNALLSKRTSRSPEPEPTRSAARSMRDIKAAMALTDTLARAYALEMALSTMAGDVALMMQAVQMGSPTDRQYAKALIGALSRHFEVELLSVLRSTDFPETTSDPKLRARSLTERGSKVRQNAELMVTSLSFIEGVSRHQVQPRIWLTWDGYFTKILNFSSAVDFHYEPNGLRSTAPSSRIKAVALSQIRADQQFCERLLVCVERLRHPEARNFAVGVLAELLPDDPGFLTRLMRATARTGENSRLNVATHRIVDRLLSYPELLCEALAWAFRFGDIQLQESILSHCSSNTHLLDRAESVASEVDNEDHRADAIVAVAQHLGGHEDLLERALRHIAETSDEHSRATGLEKLAPRFRSCSRLWGSALQVVAASIFDDGCRSRVIKAWVPIVQGDAVRMITIMQLIHTIGDARSCVVALLAVASVKCDEERHDLLQLALLKAASIDDEPVRFAALMDVAAHIKGDATLTDSILASVSYFKDGNRRARALESIAGTLVGEARQQALRCWLQIASFIDDGDARAKALAQLSRSIEPDQRRTISKVVLETSAAIGEEAIRCRVLSAVASTFRSDAESLRQALISASAFRNEKYRSTALAAVAVELEGRADFVAQALEIARTIGKQQLRADALSGIATGAGRDDELLRSVIAAIESIQNERIRSQTLVAVAGRADDRSGVEMLLRETAVRIRDPQYCAAVLTALASRSGSDDASAILALQTIATIREECSRASALASFAPCLARGERGAMVMEAARCALALNDDASRILALSALVPSLPQPKKARVLRQILDAIGALPDPESRAAALNGIIGHIDDEALLLRALQSVATIDDVNQRIGILAPVVAKPAVEAVVAAAFDAAMEKEDPHYRRQTFRSLGPHLAGSGNLLKQAIDGALAISIQTVQSRLQSLSALIPSLTGNQARLNQMLDIAHLEQAADRPVLLRAIAEASSGLPRIQSKCLEATLQLPAGTKGRVDIAIILIERSPDLLTYERWVQLLKHSRPIRRDFWHMLQHLTPAAVRLTGNCQEAQDVADAAMEVASWWP